MHDWLLFVLIAVGVAIALSPPSDARAKTVVAVAVGVLALLWILEAAGYLPAAGAGCEVRARRATLDLRPWVAGA